jgi:hypothetical protein
MSNVFVARIALPIGPCYHIRFRPQLLFQQVARDTRCLRSKGIENIYSHAPLRLLTVSRLLNSESFRLSKKT